MKNKLTALALAGMLAFATPISSGIFKGNQVRSNAQEAKTVEESVYDEIGKKFSETDRDVNVGYLLRENFTPYNSGGSGWEQVNMPGGAGIGTIVRKSVGLDSYIKKPFVEQSGEITVEFKTILISNVNSGYMSIMGRKNGKEIEAVKLRIENSTLKYVDNDGNKIPMWTLTNVNWTGIKIVANAAKNTATVYVNGVAVSALTDVSLYNGADTLCGLKFGIAATSTGSYKLGTVSVYKGYDIHETLSVAGVSAKYDVDYDYNSNASANITVDDHTIQNDNNNIAYRAFDGDETTYWEHNTNYQISKNVYFMITYGGNVVGIDTIRIKFASYYKGMISVTYQTPDDAWDRWGDGEYTWFKFETTEENNYELVMTIDEPESLVQLALGLQVGEGDYNIANQEIKISSFETYCQNPIIEDIPTFPSDWTKETPENTSVSTNGFYGSASDMEYNTFRIHDENATESVSVGKTFERKGNVTAEFKMYYEDYANGNGVGLVTSKGDSVGIATVNEKLNLVQVVDGEQTFTEISNAEAAFGDYLTKIWYTFNLKYDAAKNTMDISVNGWSPIEPVVLDEAFADATWTGFKAVSAIEETAFQIDDVKVWETQAESNVPGLEKCDTGDTILTMQACSLWREGTHVGWEGLDNERMSYRQPILGWYDEGTAEVADWEIKMAVDHGISNFMYCWYRSGAEGPIINSRYSDAIWDGLFKSKFRDDMKFTIMFENTSGLYSYNDLVENLMPYWIEVFFKNPNYQKTANGKPIFYVYNYSNFMQAIGDVNEDGTLNVADVKVATDKMREMCVEAGLPGIYLAAEDRTSSASVVRSIENCGFDALFAYTFSTGTYNISDDQTLASAKNILLSQKGAVQNEESFSVIPNISKSWDTRGWTEYGFGNASAPYMYDLEHYRQFALWVKNVYGGAVLDDQGTKMVMLDNWNEYSEGHWLFPTYGTPAYKDGRYTYGYLDILREVFGIGDFEHTDYMPLEDGFGPYDTWYPMGWDDATGCDIAVDNSINTDAIIDWQIGHNTMGGVTAYVKSVEISGETAVFDLQGANRVYFSADAVKAIVEANKEVRVEMLNGSVTLSAEQVVALNVNESLEIVLNVEVDLTDVAIVVRKTAKGAYAICDGEVYTFSLKQGGYDVEAFNAEVVMNNVSEKATGVAFYDGAVLTKSETFETTYAVSKNGQIVFVK